MQITVDEPAKDQVVVQGEKIAPLTEFIARVRNTMSVVSAGTTGEGVWGFHCALPVGIRTAVSDAPVTWNLPLDAMEAVPLTMVEMTVEEHNRRCNLDNAVSQLEHCINNMCVSPAAQSGPTIVPAGNPPNAVRPPVPTNVGGGRGEVGGARGPCERTIPPGTDVQKAQLCQIMDDTNMQQPPDTPEGHVRCDDDCASARCR
jgi:hypothetical protein